MTTRRLSILITGPTQHAIRHQGLDDDEVASVRNALILARPLTAEKARSYCAEAIGLVPDVTVSRPVVDPPSGVELVAGEDVS
jgi:hypothetical protein